MSQRNRSESVEHSGSLVLLACTSPSQRSKVVAHGAALPNL